MRSPPWSSVPEWLVRRTSELLGGTTSRRSFLSKGAMVGSALALHPVEFAFRPVSAYDSVCGNDTTCADGYSVFCCTINNGGNFCPEGTFVGGWWEADDSAFCCGAPRYYIDCNAACGSSWQCTCEDDPSTCDNRLIACNQFRYGQCNVDISCYGPVVCRVITCTAPWVFDPACLNASATDDNTVTQSAPCLPGDCPPPIIMRWSDLGGPGGFLGPEVTPVEPAPAGGGTWAEFEYGAIYDVTEGLHYVAGELWTKYQALDGPLGVLGYPTTDQLGTPDGVAAYNDFANDGAIYWTEAFGAWSIHGPIYDKWCALDAGLGFLGYPVTDQQPTPDGIGQYNHFTKVEGDLVDHGSIYWTARFGAWSIHGPIQAKWASLGWEEGFLGYPVTDQQPTPDGIGQYNHFTKVEGDLVDHGSIYWTARFGAWSIHGPIQAHWAHLGWEEGVLGYPVSDQRSTAEGTGAFNLFTKLDGHRIAYHGAIYWTPSYGPHAVYGRVLTVWRDRGAEAGPLGYPVEDRRTHTKGSSVLISQRFEHGTIYVHERGPAVVVADPLATIYESRGGPAGPLGWPVGGPRTTPAGPVVTFEGGTLGAGALRGEVGPAS